MPAYANKAPLCQCLLGEGAVVAQTIQERLKTEHGSTGGILALQARKQALADALLADNADEGTARLIDEEILADLFAPLGT